LFSNKFKIVILRKIRKSMNVIKRLIRFPFNLLGLQIVTMDAFNSQRYKINEIINKATTHYKNH
jgi:hypothetical protein